MKNRKKLYVMLFIAILGSIGILSNMAISFGADTKYEDITLDGSKTSDGIFNDDISVEYQLSNSSGIKEVRLIIEDNLVSKKKYAGNEETGELLTDIKDVQIIKAENLSQNEPEGYEYSFTLNVIDGNGNETNKVMKFKADSSIPVITINGIENQGAYNESKEISISCEDKNLPGIIANISIIKDGKVIDNKENISLEKPYVFTVSSEGSYEIIAEAKDVGEHIVRSVNNIIIDKTKPIISDLIFEGERNDGYSWFNSDVKIKADINDNVLLKNIKLFIDDKKLKDINIDVKGENIEETISKEWITLNSTDLGNFKVKIAVSDIAGNISVKEGTFYADTVVPTVSIDGITDGEYVNKKPVIIVTNEDKYASVGKIYFKVIKDDEVIKEINSDTKSFAFNDFDEGKYEIKTFVTDAAGNSSEKKSLTFTFDETKPQIDTVNVTGEKRKRYTWFYSDVNINGSASDNLAGISNILVNVEGKEVYNKKFNNATTQDISVLLNKSWIKSNESSDGNYLIEIVVTDRAGNIEILKKSFKADVETPKIGLSGIENGTYTNKNPDIKAAISDNYKHINTIKYSVTRDNSSYLNHSGVGESFSYNKFNKDGKYVVKVQAIDKAGNASPVRSITFIKDTIAPVLTISGAKEGSYTTGAKNITALVKERNYENVNVSASVLKSLDGKNTNIGFGNIKPNKENYTQSKRVNGTGTYTVKITATDKAGNKAKTKMLTFTIDNDKPIIDIEGVAVENGYDTKVTPIITYKDSYFDNKNITLSRSDGKSGKVTFTDNDSAKGGKRIYSDFARVNENDGIYTLKCTAVDKAGNSSSKTTTFSVNRFGSVYSIDEDSKALNNSYINELNQNISIIEKNVTGIDKYEVNITKDGIKESVEPIIEKGVSGGWKTYRYTLDNDLFSDEGIYDLNITSVDTVGNFSEFKNDENSFKLYVDKTAPTISVSGVSEGRSYKGDEIKAKIDVTDSIKLKGYSVSFDGKTIYDSRNAEELAASKEVLIPSGFSSDLKVTAIDMAGNSTSYTVDNITVSNNFMLRLLANKMFYIISLIILGLLGTGIFLAYRKRKKNEI